MVWKGLTSAAAVAVLACGSFAVAADQQPDGNSLNNTVAAPPSPVLLDDQTTAPSTAPAASGPTTLTPVMYLLDPTSFGKWMENNKLSVTGFIESGAWFDTNDHDQARDQPTFVFYPGQYSDHYMVDQLDLTISKAIDSTKTWDWGFTFENGYGTDDGLIHSHGILDNDLPEPLGGHGPNNQYDIVQANASLLVPLGTGLTLSAGKFPGVLGEEVINPTGNAFYTHSYSYQFGVATTVTGVLGSYTFAKAINGNDLTVEAGSTVGWNQSLRDNNSAWDFVAEASSKLTDKLKMVLNLQEGPEATHDDSDYWTTVEAIPSYTVSDQLTVSADCLYSTAPHDAATVPGATAQWYGVCGYAAYTFDSYLTPNFRIEWFRDQGALATGFQANYYEATLGVQIKPLPNDNIFQYLQIRPEIRDDWSDEPVYNLAGGGHGDHSQLSFATDVIMQF
jgi:Putative beta-barrel porin-2, OmpL-like. bbp2